MLREHDLVVLKWDKEEWGLEAGVVGTVVMVYPKGGYLVEFMDEGGNTVALLDLTDEDVRPVKGRRVRLSVSLSEELGRLLKEIALSEGKSVNAVVIEALSSYFRRKSSERDSPED
jgi:Ribbon-helix-helix protein, copG family.